VIKKFNDVHSFPITALDFNLQATMVLSGSPDGTVCATDIVSTHADNKNYHIILIIMIILIVAIIIWTGDADEINP
jgi:hypothetical protein